MSKRGYYKINDIKKEKCKALLIQGHSLRYIGHQLKIDPESVRRIRNSIDDFEELRQKKKEKLINQIWDKIDIMQEALTEKKIKSSTASQIVTQMAICVDKSALLQGQPTTIMKLSPAEKVAKIQELQEKGLLPRNFKIIGTTSEKKKPGKQVEKK